MNTKAETAVLDTVMAAKSDAERIDQARSIVGYALGMVATLEGPQAASSLAYRLADHLATRK